MSVCRYRAGDWVKTAYEGVLQVPGRPAVVWYWAIMHSVQRPATPDEIAAACMAGGDQPDQPDLP